MAKKQLHRVRGLSLGYGSDPITGETRMLDRGQVFELTGQRNDKKLVDLRYVEVFDGSESDLYDCSECGARFDSDGARTGHGDHRHPRRVRTPYEEDSWSDRAEKVAEATGALPGRPDPITVH